MLSKKHFIRIAQIISDAHKQNSGEQACDHIASDLADFFKTQNPNFKRDEFLEACEPKGYEK